MTESDIFSIAVQGGSTGIAVLLIWVMGRKIDRLSEAVFGLVGEIRGVIGHDHRRGDRS